VSLKGDKRLGPCGTKSHGLKDSRCRCVCCALLSG